MFDTREEAIAFFAEQHGFDVTAVTEALNTTREAVMPKKKVNINEVSRELERPSNRRVIASVDQDNGRVNTYLAPTPPNEGFRLEGNRYVRDERVLNVDGVKDNISADAISQWLEQFNNLIGQHLLPSTDQAQRAKIKRELQVVYQELLRSLDLDRADRNHQDRAAERGPQTSVSGVSGNNSLMEKLAMIRQTMRGIIDNPAST
jgi:hypothetical protein